MSSVLSAGKTIPVSPSEEKVPLRNWIAYFGCLLGTFMAILDIQITNSSIREIQGTLNATLNEVSWLSTAYLTAEIVIIPLSGWLASILSLRLYIFSTAFVFVLTSIFCAYSWDIHSMIIFRTLQGLSGGAMIPMALVVLLSIFPHSKRGVGSALFGVTVIFAPTVGPLIGGWLTNLYNWHFIFFINIIPGIFMLSTVWFCLEQGPRNFNLLRHGDWLGIFSMAVGLGSLQIFLEEGNKNDWLNSRFILITGIVAITFLSLFLLTEFLTKNPFINLRLLKNREFLIPCLVNLSFGMATYGTLYLLPLYLGQIAGYNALQVGQTLLWSGLPQLILIPFIPRLMLYIDWRLLIMTGIFLFSASCFMNAEMSHNTGYDQLIYAQVVRAVGQTLFMLPLTHMATGNVSPEDYGSSSSLYNMMRNLGGSIGIAILGTVLIKREQFHSNRLMDPINIFNPDTQQRLTEYTQYFAGKGADSFTASTQAVAAINLIVKREAFVMAYSDCFFILGIGLLVGGSTMLFMKKIITPEFTEKKQKSNKS
jgi:DHA2 family multidrug resistance protein